MHPDDPESYPSGSPFFLGISSTPVTKIFRNNLRNKNLKKNLVGGIAPQCKNDILIPVDAP
jgi:hypothetical protein